VTLCLHSRKDESASPQDENEPSGQPQGIGGAFSFTSLLQAIEEKIDEKIIGDVRPVTYSCELATVCSVPSVPGFRKTWRREKYEKHVY